MINNTVKGVWLINDEFHWSHFNNSFSSFIYALQVNDRIFAVSQARVLNLLDLIEIQRFP